MNVDPWEFWQNIGSPKFVTAPMVDMSELPFRLLTRRYKSDLCYTPMFHSFKFGKESKYRKNMFSTTSNDRPLFVQFCSNNAAHFLTASQYVEPQCDAVDLNLGCPQKIAKRGHYGAFIMDDWELISDIVSTSSKNLSIPVTCKMRVFKDDVQKSIHYAQMLEKSGCKVLGVHGRHIDQKGSITGLCDWDIIREIKDNVTIPVIANGNVLNFDDALACLRYTGSDAVMSAEGLLHDPTLYAQAYPPVWKIAEEFLELCREHPIPIGHIRGHIFKIFHLCLPLEPELRQKMCSADSLDDFFEITRKIKTIFEHFHTKYSLNTPFDLTLFTHNVSNNIPSSIKSSELTLSEALLEQSNITNINMVMEKLARSQVEIRILNQYINLASYKSPYANLSDILETKNLYNLSPHFDTDHEKATIYGLSSSKVVMDSSNNDFLKMSNLYQLPPWICHSVPHFT